MAMTDANEADEPKGYRRVRWPRMPVIIVSLGVVLCLVCSCIYLVVRLRTTETELRDLQAETEETAAAYQAVAEYDAAMAAGGETDLYTPTGVNESKRTKIQTGKPEEEEPIEGVRNVYLTFDDGPSSNTGRILDILAEYDVKATFFVVGKEEEQYQALYNRIVEEGHTLAMHSYSHRYNEIYQSVESYSEDLSKLQEFLYETTGVWCRFCRFPGGSSNTVSRVDMQELINYLDEQDITYFDWNISSGDAASSYISPDDLIRNCMAPLPQFQDAMILLHDATDKRSTVDALPGLIERIQAMDNTRIVPITEDTVPIHHISND